MKLREYIEQLQKFAEMNPETLDMDVIYSRDDEGNGFQEKPNNDRTFVLDDGRCVTPTQEE